MCLQHTEIEKTSPCSLHSEDDKNRVLKKDREKIDRKQKYEEKEYWEKERWRV